MTILSSSGDLPFPLNQEQNVFKGFIEQVIHSQRHMKSSQDKHLFFPIKQSKIVIKLKKAFHQFCSIKLHRGRHSKNNTMKK